jgi:hypothetical protein
MPAGALKTFSEGLGSYFFRARFRAAFFVPFFRPFLRAAMTGYTPLLWIPGFFVTRNLQLEEREPVSSRSRGPRAAVASEASRTRKSASREKHKKIEPMRSKLRILTGSQRGSIRPAPLSRKERMRGKRDQEAPEEDAQAQEEEAAEALPAQAQVARFTRTAAPPAFPRRCHARGRRSGRAADSRDGGAAGTTAPDAGAARAR